VQLPGIRQVVVVGVVVKQFEEDVGKLEEDKKLEY
jgi:hypothetical protein